VRNNVVGEAIRELMITYPQSVPDEQYNEFISVFRTGIAKEQVDKAARDQRMKDAYPSTEYARTKAIISCPFKPADRLPDPVTSDRLRRNTTFINHDGGFGTPNVDDNPRALPGADDVYGLGQYDKFRNRTRTDVSAVKLRPDGKPANSNIFAGDPMRQNGVIHPVLPRYERFSQGPFNETIIGVSAGDRASTGGAWRAEAETAMPMRPEIGPLPITGSARCNTTATMKATPAVKSNDTTAVMGAPRATPDVNQYVAGMRPNPRYITDVGKRSCKMLGRQNMVQPVTGNLMPPSFTLKQGAEMDVPMLRGTRAQQYVSTNTVMPAVSDDKPEQPWSEMMGSQLMRQGQQNGSDGGIRYAADNITWRKQGASAQRAFQQGPTVPTEHEGMVNMPLTTLKKEMQYKTRRELPTINPVHHSNARPDYVVQADSVAHLKRVPVLRKPMQPDHIKLGRSIAPTIAF
jgi:hypothetical protein